MNRICLNHAKCVAMLVASSQKLRSKPAALSISIGCTQLPIVDSVRYLGIYIDKHMKWTRQVEMVTKHARRKLFAISRLSLSKSVASLLYKAFVLPCIEYSSGE